jgi:hypothetical protein
MPSSVSVQLKRSGDVINITSAPSSNIESRWRDAQEYSSVSGLVTSDPAGSVELVIEQSIDGDEVDRADTVSSTATGSAEPFEVPLFGNQVRLRLELTGTPTDVRTLAYMSTRASSITQT